LRNVQYFTSLNIPINDPLILDGNNGLAFLVKLCKTLNIFIEVISITNVNKTINKQTHRSIRGVHV